MAAALCRVASLIPSSSYSAPCFFRKTLRPAGGGWCRNCIRPRHHLLFSTARLWPPVVCQASEKDTVAEARKFQLYATELLADLLKSDNPESTAQQHVDLLTEDFFLVASTYLEMAKKEGNVEIVNKIESTLKVAMAEKGKTLRPEIRLLNQLLSDKGAVERAKTMESNLEYLNADSYFFQLLHRMLLDVEKQRNNPKRLVLMAQLRIISKETREASKTLKRENNFGYKVSCEAEVVGVC